MSVSELTTALVEMVREVSPSFAAVSYKFLCVLTIKGIMMPTDIIKVSKVLKEIFISLITSVFCDKNTCYLSSDISAYARNLFCFAVFEYSVRTAAFLFNCPRRDSVPTFRLTPQFTRVVRQPIVICEQRKTDLALVIFTWAMKTKETKARPTHCINL